MYSPFLLPVLLISVPQIEEGSRLRESAKAAPPVPESDCRYGNMTAMHDASIYGRCARFSP